MTTTETASPLTSKVAFLDLKGNPTGLPREWTDALISVPIGPAALTETSVLVNGRRLEISVRPFGPDGQVVAFWPRAGPGWYDIQLDLADGQVRDRIAIEPAKITREGLAHILEELRVLPVAVAIALRDGGARIGIDLRDPGPQSLATELARLRRAVKGTDRPGLIDVLHHLADDHHRMLRLENVWTPRQRVRRPDPTRLVTALARPGNIEDGRLNEVVDQRVGHTVDLYENQIVGAFTTEVLRRLHWLSAALTDGQKADLAQDVEEMRFRLLGARRRAIFLDEVGPLRMSPGRVTMVLLKRPMYRAAYEGYLEFRRQQDVNLDHFSLAEPLASVPDLYQLWGTLLVLRAAVEAATSVGFEVSRQRLVWQQAGGPYLKVLRDNRPAVEMKRSDGCKLKVYPERSYSSSGKKLRGISFLQKPDIALELERSSGEYEVYLFDPKYKLLSEKDADPGDGTPKKVDVDKMHAYRDAIRDGSDQHVVRYAATLYPGVSKGYGEGVAALRMFPGEESHLRVELNRLLEEWLRN